MKKTVQQLAVFLGVTWVILNIMAPSVQLTFAQAPGCDAPGQWNGTGANGAPGQWTGKDAIGCPQPSGQSVAPTNPVDAIMQVGDKTKLPNFESGGSSAHAQASVQPGAKNITSAILFAIDLVKYAMGTLAVVMIIVSSIKLITATRKIDEVSSAAKDNIKFSMIGLVIIMIADQFIHKVFFGEQGEVYSSQSALQQAAITGSEQIKGIYSVMLYIAGAVAILMIVYSGIKLITAFGKEDEQEKAKKRLTFSIAGLIILGLAEFVVKDIIFPNQGAQLTNFDQAKLLLVKLTNFAAGFISTLAAVMFIYGGYLYVIAFGNEETTGKAKKVLVGAVIGLLIGIGAFSLVATVVTPDSVAKTSSYLPDVVPTPKAPITK